MVEETCPVCGSSVEVTAAPAQSEYEDETYYFDSPNCRRTFDDDPEEYV